jgi:hypothetical protein
MKRLQQRMAAQLEVREELIRQWREQVDPRIYGSISLRPKSTLASLVFQPDLDETSGYKLPLLKKVYPAIKADISKKPPQPVNLPVTLLDFDNLTPSSWNAQVEQGLGANSIPEKPSSESTGLERVDISKDMLHISLEPQPLYESPNSTEEQLKQHVELHSNKIIFESSLEDKSSSPHPQSTVPDTAILSASRRGSKTATLIDSLSHNSVGVRRSSLVAAPGDILADKLSDTAVSDSVVSSRSRRGSQTSTLVESIPHRNLERRRSSLVANPGEVSVEGVSGIDIGIAPVWRQVEGTSVANIMRRGSIGATLFGVERKSVIEVVEDNSGSEIDESASEPGDEEGMDESGSL